MRFESLQQDVGGNFEDDVWNEEHCQGGVVLYASELQVLDQGEGFGVGDVDAVQEGEEVEDAEEGDDAKVDLGHELLLCSVWWADDV